MIAEAKEIRENLVYRFSGKQVADSVRVLCIFHNFSCIISYSKIVMIQYFFDVSIMVDYYSELDSIFRRTTNQTAGL